MVPTMTTILQRLAGEWAVLLPPEAIQTVCREIGYTTWRDRVLTPGVTRREAGKRDIQLCLDERGSRRRDRLPGSRASPGRTGGRARPAECGRAPRACRCRRGTRGPAAAPRDPRVVA